MPDKFWRSGAFFCESVQMVCFLLIMSRIITVRRESIDKTLKAC
jgi:hypothetical protein